MAVLLINLYVYGIIISVIVLAVVLFCDLTHHSWPTDCKSLQSCPDKVIPDGRSIPAINCTSGDISPTDHEILTGNGKEISCFCGGSDPLSKYHCARQANTNWKISVMPSDDPSKPMSTITILERAGMPSQVSRGMLYMHVTLHNKPCVCGIKCRYCFWLRLQEQNDSTSNLSLL